MSWTTAAIIAQPEQRLRTRAEALLRSDRVADAFALMSEHRRDEFPPIWNPPPRSGYGEHVPNLETLAAALLQHEPRAWVVEMYMPRVKKAAMPKLGLPSYLHRESWTELEKMTQDNPIVPGAELLLQCVRQRDTTLTDDDRAALDRMLRALRR